MPRFSIDDDFHCHPKVIMAGDAAVGMWSRAGCFSTAYGTDGWVPEWWVKQQPQGRAKVKRLVDAQLWRPGVYEGDRPEYRGQKGYTFHQWRQDSYEKVESDREKSRLRKEAERQRKAAAVTPNVTRDSRRDRPRDIERDSARTRQVIPITHKEQHSGYVPESATDPTARDAIAATPAADLVRRIIPDEHPDAVRTLLRIRAGELLKSGVDPGLVEAALRLWLTKPQLGPSTLASLVSEVVKARDAPGITTVRSDFRPSTTDRVVADVQALKNRPPTRLELE